MVDLHPTSSWITSRTYFGCQRSAGRDPRQIRHDCIECTDITCSLDFSFRVLQLAESNNGTDFQAGFPDRLLMSCSDAAKRAGALAMQAWPIASRMNCILLVSVVFSRIRSFRCAMQALFTLSSRDVWEDVFSYRLWEPYPSNWLRS